MKSYRLKWKKDTENINLTISNTSNSRTMILQNVQYMVVKNPDSLKIKKQKDY